MNNIEDVYYNDLRLYQFRDILKGAIPVNIHSKPLPRKCQKLNDLAIGGMKMVIVLALFK